MSTVVIADVDFWAILRGGRTPQELYDTDWPEALDDMCREIVDRYRSMYDDRDIDYAPDVPGCVTAIRRGTPEHEEAFTVDTYDSLTAGGSRGPLAWMGDVGHAGVREDGPLVWYMHLTGEYSDGRYERFYDGIRAEVQDIVERYIFGESYESGWDDIEGDIDVVDEYMECLL